MLESNFPVDKWGVSYTVLWNTYKRLAAEMGLRRKQRALVAAYEAGALTAAELGVAVARLSTASGSSKL